MTQSPCPLCANPDDLMTFSVAEAPTPTDISICQNCMDAFSIPPEHSDHWQCLTTSMWSEETAVQVVAYRLLSQLKSESWASEALDMLYMDEDVKAWADAGLTEASTTPTRDSNGAILKAGDTVTLIKDLPVKGAGFTAKRGTAVRGISLTDNPEHIEGRVSGQRIVIITAFTKKS